MNNELNEDAGAGWCAATTRTAYYVLLGLIKAIEQQPIIRGRTSDDTTDYLLQKLHEALDATYGPPEPPESVH